MLLQNENYLLAKDYYNKVLNANNESPILKIKALSGLGEIFKIEDNIDKATDLFRQACHLSKEYQIDEGYLWGYTS